MYDKTITLGNSILNHGKYNDRIYLMKLSKDDFPMIITTLDELAKKKNYTKIFAKVPSFAFDNFIINGYMLEASIPKFYNGKDEVFFMSKFLDENRKKSDQPEIGNILNKIKNQKNLPIKPKLLDGYSYKICTKEDAYEMAKIYRNVFETYPFPIHEPNYIKKTMDENIIYFGVCIDNKLVSIASSEMDRKSQNVEMTDFATLPDYRGNSFAIFLLSQMEKEMKNKGIKTAYTIARSISYGMNITFSKLAYKYSGTLINNTNISGNLESMNIWYKYL